jgi:hypothetical protein
VSTKTPKWALELNLKERNPRDDKEQDGSGQVGCNVSHQENREELTGTRKGKVMGL